MILHGIVGLVAEGLGIYLILRMRTKVIPKRLRVRNIKLVMRTTLAIWTALVVLGVGIYYERYLVEHAAAATAPLVEFRQLGADLYVHAVELEDAVDRNSLTAVKRHAEHLINLIEGAKGLHFGDNDVDGYVEDPGDGFGLLARLDEVVTAAADPEVTAQAEAVRAQLERIVLLSVDLIGAQSLDETQATVAEIVDLAREANGQGVFRIDQAAREAGVVEAPQLDLASGRVTVHEDQFLFLPAELTVPVGTTVVWVNDEQAKHTATADDELFDTGDQRLGDSYSYTFTEPGAYPYFCRYHGDVGGVGMAGVIVVE
jgi:plastocyanin